MKKKLSPYSSVLTRVENYRLLAWCYKANSKSNFSKEATIAKTLFSSI